MSQSNCVPTKTIDDLPPEMLQEVLRPLSLLNLIRCKLVCKRWNELISRMKVERLFVDDDLEIKKRWFYSNMSNKPWELACSQLFVAQHKRAILSNLKYLRLDYEVSNDDLKQPKVLRFDPNILNEFKQLIHLEIDNYEAGELHLKLSNLEILSLNWFYNTNSVSIDCPKLTIMRFWEQPENDQLRMKHIDRIRVLYSSILGAKLARFKNLEKLYCDQYDQELPDQFTLSKLKQLKLIYCGLGFGRYDIGRPFWDLQQRIREFMRLKRVLGRKDLQVYFAGLLLIDEDLSDINFGLEVRESLEFISPEQLYMRHYHRLQDELDFVVQVEYNRLFSLVDVLPDDYFRRFLNLRYVDAICPLNESDFLAFLRQIYSLECLSISRSDLTQIFFDSLPEFCSLFTIYMTETDKPSVSSEELQLNFSFFKKFRRLCFVEIEKNLSLSSLRSLFGAFEHQKNMFEDKLSFYFRGELFEILKNTTSYDLKTYPKKTLFEGVSLTKVIDYFERLEKQIN